MVLIGRLTDEKDLVIVALIAALFIATTLSFEVGILFIAMIITYGIALNQGRGRIYEIIKGKAAIPSSIVLAAVFVGIWYFISQVALSVVGPPGADTFSVLAAAVNIPFTIDSPIVQVLVWGIFIPFAETVFFLGVALKFIQKKAKAKEKLNDISTWVGIIGIGALVSLFHVVVRLFNDSALIVDFAFFALSAAFVIQQRGELKGPLFAHIIVNVAVMSTIVGFI